MSEGQPYHFAPHRGSTISAALRRPTCSRLAPRLPSEKYHRHRSPRPCLSPKALTGKSKKVFLALSLQHYNYLVIKRKALFYFAKAPIWAPSSLAVRLQLRKHFPLVSRRKSKKATTCCAKCCSNCHVIRCTNTGSRWRTYRKRHQISILFAEQTDCFDPW